MRYLIIFLLFISTACLGQLSESDQLLISNICEKYKTCLSYQDSGTIEITNINLEVGNESLRRGSFKTIYKPTTGFKFSFNIHSVDNPIIFYKLIIQKDIDSTYSNYYLKRGNNKPIIKQIPLKRSIAKATGTTSALVNYVPKMLIENEISGSHFLKTKKGFFERIQDETSDGNDFYKFKLTYELDRDKALSIPDNEIDSTGKDLNDRYTNQDIVHIEEISWFSKKDFLLKKIERTHTDSDNIYKTIITYQPTINKEIENELLELNLPKE